MEQPPKPSSQIEEPHQAENESRPPVLPQNQTHPTPEIETNDAMSPAQSVPDNVKPIPAFQPRRYEGARRTPACLEDYDLSSTFEHWLELALSLLYQFLLLFLFSLIL